MGALELPQPARLTIIAKPSKIDKIRFFFMSSTPLIILFNLKEQGSIIQKAVTAWDTIVSGPAMDPGHLPDV